MRFHTDLSDQAFRDYLKLSPREIEAQEQDWDDYYAKSRETKRARLWKEMRTAFAQHNGQRLAELRDISDKLRRATLELQKPPFADPRMVFFYMPREFKQELFERIDSKVKAKESAQQSFQQADESLMMAEAFR